MAEEEVAKLKKHLALLRQEYVKMQQRLADTERRYAMLAAQAASQGTSSPNAPASTATGDTFISRLLEIVCELYQQEQYSDLKVKIAGEDLHAHKFVLAARSDVWSLANLATTAELDLSGEQSCYQHHHHHTYLRLQHPAALHYNALLISQCADIWLLW
ncbi:hypothetical protein CRUP_030832 [Coryphaenoides rupestris]|nr:hypothetical protein CRUP_030832 [Coryphaenoides rupestris]